MESIWLDTELPHFPPLWGEVHTDVLIIGGGMAGLCCAHALQEAGISCVVVEKSRLAGGNTRNTTAKITAQHGLCFDKLLRRFGTELAQAYLQANLSAISSFASMAREIDCDFSRTDHTVYTRSGVQQLETELAALNKLGYPAVFREKLPLPFPTAGGICFPDQAQFHPLKFLSGLSADLTIYENTPVLQLTPHLAITEKGEIHFSKAIVATHFPLLNKYGLFFLKLYQQRSYAVSLEGLPPLDGMYLEENGLSLRSSGDAQILGGGGHRTGKRGGGWQALEAAAQRYFPEGTIVKRWAAQDCMTLDGLPYVGQYSKRTPWLYVATGFNKWGMTNSMVASQLLTCLILEKPHPCKMLLSPQRRMLRPQLAVNGWESAVNLLSPGLRRCTHMGCRLVWNSQEHSWDCPCHGSRYTQSGQVLDNPAVKPLPAFWRRELREKK